MAEGPGKRRYRLRRRRIRKRLARRKLQGVTGTVQAAFHTPPSVNTSGDPPDHSQKVQWSGQRMSETGNHLKGAAQAMKELRMTPPTLRR